MVAVTICSDFGAQENKVSHGFHCFYLPWSDETRCHDFVFWMLSFKPAFSLFSFTLIKGLFSSSSLFAIMVVSSAYLTLIFLLAVLIPACNSSSPAFCMMNSVAAAATAKSLQSCPTLCDPINSSPPGFPIPGILQARTLELLAISFSSAWKWKVEVKLLSHVRV